MPSKKIADFKRSLLEKATLQEGIHAISDFLKKVTLAERASIFIYDQNEDQLWTLHADESEKIIIPFDIGLAGLTVSTERAILENDPYDNPNFLSDIDMRTGYYTQNVLTAPIFNIKEQIIGVIQLLNREGGFSKKERHFLEHFSKHISKYIELRCIERMN